MGFSGAQDLREPRHGCLTQPNGDVSREATQFFDNNGGRGAFCRVWYRGEKQKTGCTDWTHFSLIGGYMLIDIFPC